MRHFLTTQDYTRAEIEQLLDRAAALQEAARRAAPARSGHRAALLQPLAAHARLVRHRRPPARRPRGRARARQGLVADRVRGGRRDGRRDARSTSTRSPACSRATSTSSASAPSRSSSAGRTIARTACSRASRATRPCPSSTWRPSRTRARSSRSPSRCRERLGSLQGKKFVLTWTYHPRPAQHRRRQLGRPHRHQARHGRDAALPERGVPPRPALPRRRPRERGRERAALPRSPTTSTRPTAGADVVYAKSWGAIPYFGRWDEEKPMRDRLQALHRRRAQDGAHPRTGSSRTACRSGATSR